MDRPALLLFAAGLLATPLAASPLGAQRSGPLPVGTPAPEFALTGATSAGVADHPVRLRDFRDQTVVIAFFYKARTKG
jgi:thioredoxin-dependent peroxiredoxin